MEATMAVNLSIKEVPDALADRLRARAERHHRSLQGELMAIIEQAAAEEPRPAAGFQRQPFVDVFPRGTKTIEQIAAAHRLRFPEPISDGPMAVDIIRADRDSR
jgi:Arc-like DNA binding domain